MHHLHWYWHHRYAGLRVWGLPILCWQADKMTLGECISEWAVCACIELPARTALGHMTPLVIPNRGECAHPVLAGRQDDSRRDALAHCAGDLACRGSKAHAWVVQGLARHTCTYVDQCTRLCYDCSKSHTGMCVERAFALNRDVIDLY